MTSIKVKFRKSSVKNRDGILFYQIIHCRKIKQIFTGLRIGAEEWKGENSTPLIQSGCRQRNMYLESVRSRIRSDMSRLQSIVSYFDSCKESYTVDDIADLFFRPDIVIGFVSFTRDLIDKLNTVGKRKISKRFSITLSSFSKYIGYKEILWTDFNSTLISGYEEYLLSRGLCRNTTSFYMRNLRSIANRAAECGYETPRNLFKHVYMGVDKTVKRAVTLKTICRIRDVDLHANPILDYARNIFMFSFYTRGMSFIDIAFLKKSDISNGVISYRRRKTHRLLRVKIEAQIEKIIDCMSDCDSVYLLPIITDNSIDGERQYLNAYHRVNRNLKTLGAMLGLDIKLTMYVARHAWASIASHNNIPVSTISEAMGHDSEQTTRIYLSTLDASSVDRANNKILRLMMSE